MKIFKYLLIAAAPMLVASCLDTEPLGRTVTSEQKTQTAEKNPERLEASVNAISTNFSVYGNVYGTSSLRHCDFGYAATMLCLDSRGVDMVSDNIGYNWFTDPLTFEDVEIRGYTGTMAWGNLYKQIYSANAVTGMVSADTEDRTLQYDLAQALTIRAYDYFVLAQIFQQPYTAVDPSTAPAVPLITEANQEDAAANGCPRASVKDVYDQVLSDLGKAIELFEASGVKRADKRYADASVAHGIRARVYLTMEKWNEALADANYVIEKSNCKPYTISQVSKPTFTTMEDDSWVWGIKIAETDRVVTSAIVNWPSHLCSLSYGYASVGAWRYINKKLFKQIPESDVRRGWWLDENKESVNLNVAQMTYVGSAGIPAFANVKFAPYKDELGTSTNASDIPLMRIEEMYLIKAEAEAMSGNASAGATTLFNFVKTYRNPEYMLTASTASEVQDAVFFQRRLELWGEGLIWFDYQRLGKAIDRRGGGFGETECYNIPAGDDARILMIPETETEYNSQISAAENNRAASKPTPVADDEE